MAYQLIVPPRVETELTGYLGSVRNQAKCGATEVKFYAHAPHFRCEKNGKSVAWEDLPRAAQLAANRGAKMLGFTERAA